MFRHCLIIFVWKTKQRSLLGWTAATNQDVCLFCGKTVLRFNRSICQTTQWHCPFSENLFSIHLGLATLRLMSKTTIRRLACFMVAEEPVACQATSNWTTFVSWLRLSTPSNQCMSLPEHSNDQNWCSVLFQGWIWDNNQITIEGNVARPGWTMVDHLADGSTFGSPKVTKQWVDIWVWQTWNPRVCWMTCIGCMYLPHVSYNYWFLSS